MPDLGAWMTRSTEDPLHAAAMRSGEEGTDEALMHLGRAPIADECQHCEVCRWGREYVDRRLRERAGERFPPGLGPDDALHQLHSAVATTRAAIHGPS